jgi:hypothetical protein
MLPSAVRLFAPSVLAIAGSFPGLVDLGAGASSADDQATEGNGCADFKAHD